MLQSELPETQDRPGGRAYWPGVSVLAALYLALAGTYAARLPVLGGPDEAAHWQYVRVLREQVRLPVLPRLAGPGDSGRVADQAQHPPLYYAVLAAVSYAYTELDDTRAPRLLKLVSVLMGLGTVLAMALMARRLWPTDAPAALGAVGLVALLPNVAYLNALLNNTAGALLGSALALLALERALSSPGLPWRRWGLVGLVTGLAVLAKVTAIWLLPTMAVALVLKVLAERRPRCDAVIAVAAALIPVVAIVGSWLTRNVLDFGELMPERVLDRRYAPLGLMVLLFDTFALKLLLWVMTVSIPLSMVSPWWVLRTGVSHGAGMALLAVAMLPALGGGIMGMWGVRGRFLDHLTPRCMVLAACLVGGVAAWVVAMQAVLHDWSAGLYAGRYAIEAAPALGLLWAAGLTHACRRTAVRSGIIAAGLAVLLAANVATCLFLLRFFGGQT